MSPVPSQIAQAFEMLPAGLRENARDYFAYSFPLFDPLAVSASQTETVNIQADSDFLIMAIAGTARDPADPTSVLTDPAITVRIEDTGSGRNIQNRATDWRNMMGTGELLFYLPFPKYIDANSQVALTLENLDAAQAYNCRVALHGFKVFDFKWGAA